MGSSKFMFWSGRYPLLRLTSYNARPDITILQNGINTSIFNCFTGLSYEKFDMYKLFLILLANGDIGGLNRLVCITLPNAEVFSSLAFVNWSARYARSQQA